MSNFKNKLTLILSVLGIVYGDIGTSPLYAIKSCFTISSIQVNHHNIFGLIGIIILTLILIVSIKYIKIVININKNGDGGILVLSSLILKVVTRKARYIIMAMGIFGMTLLFGDGVITPAISILSALEGLHIISPNLSKHVIIISIIILILLFIIQKNGSGFIGKFFGPIMITWFIVLGLLGIHNIAITPEIFQALNPYYIYLFIKINGIHTLFIMGGVILVVSGAEALYADMGHFGKDAIKLSWKYIVMPSLMLNYLGQGALLLRDPTAISSPFYLMIPSQFLYPMIALSTLATIIASQAMISGIFSLSWQCIMLNYLPRMRIIHTSHDQIGQVYLPVMNWILCVLTIISVAIFQTSANLASAYGLSVSLAMLNTTILTIIIMHYRFKWPIYKIILIFAPILLLDSIFSIMNMTKFLEGAWYGILVTSICCYIITVWINGNRTLNKQKLLLKQQDLYRFIIKYEKKYKERIPTTAIFMCRNPKKIPDSLLIHLQHNKFLHKKLIFISILIKKVPRISKDKLIFKTITTNISAITVYYGFKEIPNLHKILIWCKENKLLKDNENPSFFLSHGMPLPKQSNNIIKIFNKKLYIYLARNSIAAYEFYHMPYKNIVEFGIRYKV